MAANAEPFRRTIKRLCARLYTDLDTMEKMGSEGTVNYMLASWINQHLELVSLTATPLTLGPFPREIPTPRFAAFSMTQEEMLKATMAGLGGIFFALVSAFALGNDDKEDQFIYSMCVGAVSALMYTGYANRAPLAERAGYYIENKIKPWALTVDWTKWMVSTAVGMTAGAEANPRRSRPNAN